MAYAAKGRGAAFGRGALALWRRVMRQMGGVTVWRGMTVWQGALAIWRGCVRQHGDAATWRGTSVWRGAMRQYGVWQCGGVRGIMAWSYDIQAYGSMAGHMRHYVGARQYGRASWFGMLTQWGRRYGRVRQHGRQMFVGITARCVGISAWCVIWAYARRYMGAWHGHVRRAGQTVVSNGIVAQALRHVRFWHVDVGMRRYGAVLSAMWHRHCGRYGIAAHAAK